MFNQSRLAATDAHYQFPDQAISSDVKILAVSRLFRKLNSLAST